MKAPPRQLGLFDRPRQAAATRVPQRQALERLHRTGRGGKQRRAVLAALAEHVYDGLTRAELAAKAGISVQAACGRLGELRDPDAGEHLVLARGPLVCVAPWRRPGGHGTDVTVYLITAAGLRELEKLRRAEAAATTKGAKP